jgi:hypothetical protein
VLEVGDSTFRSDADVARVLALPVLAVVPRMRTEGERRLQRRRMAALAATVFGLAGTAAVALWRLRS